MILACHDVSKAFGEHVIIQNGSFHIEDHEKAALIGINECKRQVYSSENDRRRSYS